MHLRFAENIIYVIRFTARVPEDKEGNQRAEGKFMGRKKVSPVFKPEKYLESGAGISGNADEQYLRNDPYSGEF